MDEKSFKAQGNLIICTHDQSRFAVEHVVSYHISHKVDPAAGTEILEPMIVGLEMINDAMDDKIFVLHGTIEDFDEAYAAAYKYAKTLDTLMLLQASCPGECQDEDE